MIHGTGTKRMMIRALGPSLTASGVTYVEPHPVLDLFDGSGRLLATNDGWMTNYNEQEIIDTGIAPSSALESAMVIKLPASDNGSAYTAVLREGGFESGISLLEVYDLDTEDGNTVLNNSVTAYG